MGAITKTEVITGSTLKQAFSELQDLDRDELGSDHYSGGWNNLYGVTEVSKSKFDECEKEGGPSRHENGLAWCTRKPILNTMKVKTSVTSYPNVGTRKWTTKYEVECPKHGNILISELKQADAIKKARQLVEKDNTLRLTVHIVKTLESDSKVATIDYKKSSTERDGTWEIIGTMSY
tara:strand:- start:3383 stop:3913 length:531 start_codon:yes stop_codon:yes gene_type:complete